MSNMPKKQKIYLVIIIVILAFYVLDFSSKSGKSASSVGSIKKIEAEINAKKIEKYNLLQQRSNDMAKLSVVKNNGVYFWTTGGRVPTLKIQSELEKTASAVNLRFRSISSPRETVVSDNIKRVQLSITLHCSMREASRFFFEVEKMRPAFFWDSCSIRSDRGSQYSKVIITGSLVSYVLDKSASRLLADEKEVPK